MSQLYIFEIHLIDMEAADSGVISYLDDRKKNWSVVWFATGSYIWQQNVLTEYYDTWSHEASKLVDLPSDIASKLLKFQFVVLFVIDPYVKVNTFDTIC